MCIIGFGFISHLTIFSYSSLDGHVVSGESIGSFKRRLDQSVDRDDRWDG